MDSSTIDELLEVFSAHQTFYYYKDKFVIDRILRSGQEQINTQTLRNAGLLQCANNALVKKLLTMAQGALLPQDLYSYWPEDGLCFNITFGKWGEAPLKGRKADWYQTSRSGYSLVLQLNFSTEHIRDFFRYLKPDSGIHTFQYGGHPIAKRKFATMGWCRMDVDFETDEVLIEELQTDWLREVSALEKRLKVLKTEENAKHCLECHGLSTSKEHWNKYLSTFHKYSSVWSEALLHASVDFARKELGINNVWMHSYDSGNLFKELKWSKPPKSLYTKLPKKYGFEPVKEGPAFLQKERYLKRYFKTAAQKNVGWYKLPKYNSM